MSDAPLRLDYDYATDTLTVEGIRYSGDLFRHFSLAPTGVGELYTIVNRKDGVVAIKTIRDRELFERFELVAAAGMSHA